MPLAVPVEPTLAPGQTIASAWANASVRDAVNFLINPPLVALNQATLQSIPNVSVTAISFDATMTDPYGGHSNAVSNSRYTVQLAGWYWVHGGVRYAASATGDRVVLLHKNGTEFMHTPTGVPSASTGINPAITTGFAVNCSVGDYLEICTYQDTGGAINTAVATSESSSMAVWWIHA